MLYNFVIDLLKKPLSERSDNESNTICQWLIKNFRIFSKISTETVDDIVQNSRLIEVDENALLIKQNDMGSTFFIILNGKVSVYITPDMGMDQDDDQTGSVLGNKNYSTESIDNFLIVTDKNRYGNFIGFIESGSGFGEMALISDCLRSATIISETKSQFLVLDKVVYNRSLRKSQEMEFQAFTSFVNNSPIFYNWAPRYKKQVAMSLRRSTFPFETEIIKQGDKINGLGFIIEGQAKVVMDITQHSQQYPDLNIRDNFKQSKERRSSLKSGFLYQSLEKVKNLKHLELSLIGPGEIIGDIEQAFGLDTSFKTLIPVETTEVYFLSERNYERLVTSKKNQTTVDMINKWAEQKLLSQFRRKAYQEIPLISTLVNSILTKRMKPENQQAESDSKRQSISKQHDFISRGPIIDMFGPGTAFYRNRQLRHKNEVKRSKSNDPKTKDLYSNDMKFDNKLNSSSPPLEQDSTFLDWETCSTKLENLENNIESWLKADSKSGKSNVPKLKRFVKKGSEIVRPGKTIILKPKNPHKLADIVNRNNFNSDIDIHQKAN